MKHIVFPTYELFPVNPGGAGVLISGAVRMLAAAGVRVTVLCDFPEAEVRRSNEFFESEGFASHQLQALQVSELLGDRYPESDTSSVFEVNSVRFANALDHLHKLDPFDAIEFPEYAGFAVATLKRRAAGRFPSDVTIAVRIHGSLEMIDRSMGLSSIEVGQLRMYKMERLALLMADRVLSPSQGMSELYRSAYGISSDRVILSAPPMEVLLNGFVPLPRLPDPGHFLFYGKLQEVKGADVFAQAATSLAIEHPSRHWRFTFVGRDIYCGVHHRMTSSCLDTHIPAPVRPAFEFLPAINRVDLPLLTQRPMAAVVPSRFETFCLAAHELRACGIPLIVPRIPGFVDYLNEHTGCLTYDGTANGLREVIRRVREDTALQDALSLAPRPVYPPFVEAYTRLFETPITALNIAEVTLWRQDFAGLA